MNIPYQAIEVKFLPPTNYRGPRWKATAAAGSVTIDQHSGMNPEENATYAAERLCNKFGWLDYSDLVIGQLKNGSYVFVQVNKRIK